MHFSLISCFVRWTKCNSNLLLMFERLYIRLPEVRVNWIYHLLWIRQFCWSSCSLRLRRIVLTKIHPLIIEIFVFLAIDIKFRLVLGQFLHLPSITNVFKCSPWLSRQILKELHAYANEVILFRSSKTEPEAVFFW